MLNSIQQFIRQIWRHFVINWIRICAHQLHLKVTNYLYDTRVRVCDQKITIVRKRSRKTTKSHIKMFCDTCLCLLSLITELFIHV